MARLMARLMAWLTARLAPRRSAAARRAAMPPEWQAAADLVAAVDRGGVPLNPARVNQIARQLGLEVSTRAPVAATIERIRAVLAARPPG